MRGEVLVVEDEANIRSFIVLNLQMNDFNVKEAGSGEEAIEVCEGCTPGIAVLDIMLPGMDGYELCKILREKFPKIIIIMLTAKAQDADKIAGLDIGADDYMIKPFNPIELVSRINAIQRRIKRYEDDITDKNTMKFKDLTLNLVSQKFFKGDREILLTQKEYAIIKLFIENPDKAFSRNELLDNVWGKNYFGDYKTVDVHIRRLREKIENNPSNPGYIKTIWGYGYRL